jgi:hypothetical protein
MKLNYEIELWNWIMKLIRENKGNNEYFLQCLNYYNIVVDIKYMIKCMYLCDEVVCQYKQQNKEKHNFQQHFWIWNK